MEIAFGGGEGDTESWGDTCRQAMKKGATGGALKSS
jgi:hypothetical protein